MGKLIFSNYNHGEGVWLVIDASNLLSAFKSVLYGIQTSPLSH